jgi:uncharacterized peroxidase-related enzyme
MAHHRRGLRRLLKDDALLAAIEQDWRTTDLDERRRAMLHFATKLTDRPGAMEEADVEGLRRAGLSDRDVLHLTEVVAYYAYANRMVDALGAELEEWIPDDA